jgi:hypothetical protein
MDANTSSPSSKSASIPEIRGDPSARCEVAIVLCPRVEQRPNPLRELRLGAFDLPPRRHPGMITSNRQQGHGFGQCPRRLFNPAGTARQIACHRESVREAECQLSTPSATVKSRSGDLEPSVSYPETRP